MKKFSNDSSTLITTSRRNMRSNDKKELNDIIGTSFGNESDVKKEIPIITNASRIIKPKPLD